MSAFLDQVMTEMAVNHPTFGCEAEFQLELALWFRQHMPGLEVHLEVNAYDTPRNRLDMSLSFPDSQTAVELKLSKKAGGAEDAQRYGFIKDICRLEKLCDAKEWARGYAINLSDYAPYWTKLSNEDTKGEQFQIYDNHEVHGHLDWQNDPTPEIQETYPALNVRGHYRMQWKPYGTSGLKYVVATIH